MPRYIDADALIEHIKQQYHCDDCDNYNGVKCRACHVDDEIGDIEDAPTADVVPVWVRVKDGLPNEKINPNTHDFEYVLCYTIFGDVRPYKYGAPMLTKSPHFWNGGVRMDECVTHWQYMPKPPMEVSE